MNKELLQLALDALELQPRVQTIDGHAYSHTVARDVAIHRLKQALAQQEQPASVDAYVGAREDAAIWKKRALEAEELNRKFIAELNGPTYLGEPAQQEQPSVAILKSEAATWKATASANQEELATVWRMNDDLKAEIALLKKKERPAQKPDLWKTQFLTDVMTSAGLLRYGRTDKKLAQRIADGSARWRTELYASASTEQTQCIPTPQTRARTRTCSIER